MTPEAQRVAIAEACGMEKTFGHDYPGCKDLENFFTSDCAFGCGCWMGSARSGGPEGINPFGTCPKSPGMYPCLPDYPNDLNAIHDAETRLLLSAPRLRQRYMAELRAITADIDVWHASASQRCEALLRALGLWRDDAPVAQPQTSTSIQT